MIFSTCELRTGFDLLRPVLIRYTRTEYTSPTPQRGMTFLPPRALNVAENEIARAFKCVGTTVEPISFVVPRKVRPSSPFSFYPLLTVRSSRTPSKPISSPDRKSVV